MARDLQCPDNQRKLEKQGWLQFGPYEQGLEMEMQRWVCVIDLFGVSYDGTMPTIVLACDERWLGLFAVAPPNPPALEFADPEGRLCFSF